MYTQLSETEQFVTILATIEQLNNIWTKYNENQSKYFKEVSKKLENAVYGLDDAKNQIKRLLAQWVNGNDLSLLVNVSKKCQLKILLAERYFLN